MLLKYLDIIKDVSISAVTTHCKECACHGCPYKPFHDCTSKLQTDFTDKIILALAIEKVKERANESKD